MLKHLRKTSPEKLALQRTNQKDSPLRFWLAGGGYDQNLDNPLTIKKAIYYIHRNPMRKGLVEEPSEWEFSSYNEWNEPGAGLISIDRDTFPF